MADTTVPGDEAEEEGWLVGWYRTYIGVPQRRVDVYVGFGVFVAGLALALAGLALFLAERGMVPGRDFALREAAFAAGALGLPVLLSGVVVLLPGDRRVLAVGVGGTAVCLVAVAFFVSVYPGDWNVTSGPDYSALGTALYAAGVVPVVAAAAAALVGYHVERVSGAGAGEPEGETDESESWTAAEIEADIEAALADAELSWGGVPVEETRKLTVTADDSLEAGFEGAGREAVRSQGVDDAVAGLQGLKGGTDRTARGSSTDDQAAALRELREQQAAEPEGDGGVIARVRGWFDRT
ncbi:DUF7139 domain-containing protein [Haloglomus litoreum]|uniref:DUF7139 domain-containing protein n=1 Tax=Haloglomus litoreum TaxID=3034026 RepID=UPI0023E784D0|nr:hypothetical protein [Haloglomus sp. DT116]